MRYLDVCSGYSAASLAWHDFGWEPAGYAEIDPFAAGVLAQRHGATMPMRMPDPDAPDLKLIDRKLRHTAIKNLRDYHWSDRVPNFGDFTTIGAEDVGPVQLLIGGTPCQSFSQAGLRLGLADPRGNLTLEFLALAKRIRPDWLVWENVPGFLSHDGGRTAEPSSGSWGNSGMGGPTECLTLNISEWTAPRGLSPSDDGVCSLSDVLETQQLPQRYYLTPKACAGILARAVGRAKRLPDLLRQVLESVAGSMKPSAEASSPPECSPSENMRKTEQPRPSKPATSKMPPTSSTDQLSLLP